MEVSRLILVRSSVYILGIRRQASVDNTSGWCRSGSGGGDFSPACLPRTDGMLYSHEVAYCDR